tara:strand:- start:657 stop:866 length:210 start_codon:yes stop_codon:yes gene_type:complete
MEDKNRPTGLSHKDYTEKQLEHIYMIWLYTYGGAGDVVSLDQFIYDYDDNPDEYGNCPCYICQTGDYTV